MWSSAKSWIFVLHWARHWIWEESSLDSEWEVCCNEKGNCRLAQRIGTGRDFLVDSLFADLIDALRISDFAGVAASASSASVGDTGTVFIVHDSRLDWLGISRPGSFGVGEDVLVSHDSWHPFIDHHASGPVIWVLVSGLRYFSRFYILEVPFHDESGVISDANLAGWCRGSSMGGGNE